MYLLGRSAGLSAWSMAQRVEHYLSTQEGKDTLGMAHTVLLLRQEDDLALRDATQRFQLSPGRWSGCPWRGSVRASSHTSTRGNACLNIRPARWCWSGSPSPSPHSPTEPDWSPDAPSVGDTEGVGWRQQEAATERTQKRIKVPNRQATPA